MGQDPAPRDRVSSVEADLKQRAQGGSRARWLAPPQEVRVVRRAEPACPPVAGDASARVERCRRGRDDGDRRNQGGTGVGGICPLGCCASPPCDCRCYGTAPGIDLPFACRLQSALRRRADCPDSGKADEWDQASERAKRSVTDQFQTIMIIARVRSRSVTNARQMRFSSNSWKLGLSHVSGPGQRSGHEARIDWGGWDKSTRW